MSSLHLDEELSAFLDDELSPEERARVTAHLEACGECKTLLQRLERTSAFVRDLPIPKAPPGVTDAAMRLVMARNRPSSPSWFAQISEALTSKFGLGMVTGLAAAGLALFVSLQISGRDSGTPTYSRVAATIEPNRSPPGEAGGAAFPPGGVAPGAVPPGVAGPLAGGGAPSGPLAGGAPSASSGPDISGALTVSNLQAAVQQVRSIASIVGGQEVGMPEQVAPGQMLVVADIPQAQLSRFNAGLGLVGRWDVIRAQPPQGGSDVRVEVRIAEGTP
jgi:anti-sigma factor RsiW